MDITISSVFITICISFLLILFLNYLMVNTNKLKIFRTDFFTFLILIIVLRLIFPTELFFTITIPASKLMNPIVELFNSKVISNITVLHIVLCIWLLSSIIYGLRFIYQISNSYRIVKRLQQKSVCCKVSELLKDYEGKDYPVMISSIVNSPMVFGLKKIIFLPNVEFTDKELHNIVYHELQHIKNQDIYIKVFINILTMIYWWFPPIYLLRKNIDLFLEIRVDDQVTRKMSTESRLCYTESLINVQRKVKKERNKGYVFSTFINDSSNILSYRIHNKCRLFALRFFVFE